MFFGLIALSLARNMDASSPIDIEALIASNSDMVTKINSSELPLLPPGQYLIQFTDPSPLNPYFDYENQQYYVYLPVNFSRVTEFSLGIVGFLSHTNEWGLWSIYKSIFDDRNLIYVCPQGVGNMVSDVIRKTAFSTAISYFRNVLPIDPERVYASGLSGGARMSCQLLWDNATYLSGAVSICGCDYPRHVTLSSASDPSYGFYDSYPLPNDVLSAYAKVVIITGSNDFLDSNLNDMYYNGMMQDNLTAWLIDVPGMGHEMADYLTYEQAITILDENPRKCVYPCKDCNLNRTDCTQCFASLNMNLYIDNATSFGSCVEFCPDGYYSYNAVCLESCPEGTVVSNDGYQDICSDESTVETTETTEEATETTEETTETSR